MQSILAYFRIILSTLLKRYDNLFISLLTKRILGNILLLLFINMNYFTGISSIVNGEIQIFHEYFHSVISKIIAIYSEIINSAKHAPLVAIGECGVTKDLI